MRSINRLAGAALLGTSLALAAPAVGHAAPARSQVNPADCAKAVAAAAKAQLQYDAAVAEYGKDAAAAGGKPDKSRQEQLDRAKHEFDAAASAAVKACPEVKSAGEKSGSGDKTGSGEKAATESGHDKGRADSAEDTHDSTGGYEGSHAAAPSGSMHTGAGGTSTDAGGSEIALGAGLFAAGAGVLVLRRRRRAAGRI
ncbi:hypothetical protein OG948_44200 (plasmid) [Embleya sp. NBC_00888]|uniref:hypothetical protein n=1 Tax=Embleya sp. NBC_00888 TaxID=2975960 RepID=UPI002F91B51A|nr:hypothetical protein OG948_44200 [Embleya sp. NBC_00888]